MIEDFGAPDDILGVSANHDAESYINAEWAAAVKGLIKWSKRRSPDEWIKILSRLGEDVSGDTFRRRRESDEFRQHPDSTTKRVMIAIDDLPSGYSDEMKV